MQRKMMYVVRHFPTENGKEALWFSYSITGFPGTYDMDSSHLDLKIDVLLMLSTSL